MTTGHVLGDHGHVSIVISPFSGWQGKDEGNAIPLLFRNDPRVMLICTGRPKMESHPSLRESCIRTSQLCIYRASRGCVEESKCFCCRGFLDNVHSSIQLDRRSTLGVQGVTFKIPKPFTPSKYG